MQTHVETLFTLDMSGRLLAVNASEGGPVPRMFIGQTAAATQCWFRRDVGRELVLALDGMCRAEPPVADLAKPTLRSEPYEEVLGAESEVESVSAGPTYCFPDRIQGGSSAEFIEDAQKELLDPYLADWLEDVADCQPFAIMRSGDRAVALCATVRRSATAEEAGVETHPDFRGRGFAGEVVAAWARAVRESGRTPLYSTSWTNHASVAVARKLGLVQYGAVLHIR